VKREDKYKAKNIIETFVYRGGDSVAAWVSPTFAALGLTLAGSRCRRSAALVWLVLRASGWAQTIVTCPGIDRSASKSVISNPPRRRARGRAATAHHLLAFRH